LESVEIVRDVGPAPTVRGNKWRLARLLLDELRVGIASLEEEGQPAATLELHTSTDPRGYAKARLSIRARSAASGADVDGYAERPAREPKERSAIASLGGELLLRRGPGTYELALFLPPLRATATEREAARPSEGERGCVLVVDDEPMI